MKTLDEMMQELVSQHGAMECAIALYDAAKGRYETAEGSKFDGLHTECAQIMDALETTVNG